MTKAVCLVGFGTSRDGWMDMPEGVPIWSVNHAWRYGIEYDLLLDIHPIEHLRQRPDNPAAADHEFEHWQRLHEGRVGAPVYMLEAYPDIPESVRYPIEDVLAIIKRPFITSGPEYLVGLAILQGYDRIYTCGFDMNSESEYRYQREGMSWIIGYCDGAGIDLVLPKGSTLCNAKLYGYEGNQMISRQTLEFHLKSYEGQREEMIGRVNWMDGVMRERMHNAEAEPDEAKRSEIQKAIHEADTEKRRFLRVVYGIDGAIQAMKHLIDNCDMEEVDPVIVDKVRTVSV